MLLWTVEAMCGKAVRNRLNEKFVEISIHYGHSLENIVTDKVPELKADFWSKFAWADVVVLHSCAHDAGAVRVGDKPDKFRQHGRHFSPLKEYKHNLMALISQIQASLQKSKKRIVWLSCGAQTWSEGKKSHLKGQVAAYSKEYLFQKPGDPHCS